MNDKLDITLRIADCKPLRMTIAREREESIRRAEYNVNQLWRKWSAKHSDKSSHDILAMVAFRFAELLLDQNALTTGASELLGTFEKTLDSIIHGTDAHGGVTADDDTSAPRHPDVTD